MYFIQCNSAGGLTHAGTGKTLMTTFDNRQLLESTYDNNIQEIYQVNRMTIRKELSEMSLEELWELFPIFLVEHNEKWADHYNEMERNLREMLPAGAIDRISHIGSTAIQNIWAKNIVDIMVEIPHSAHMEEVARILEQNGFTRMSAEAKRISLNKGYTKDGFADKVYHIHLRFSGDNDEIYFRDYLNAHPDVAKEYETLKLQLWRKYEHNRGAYTDAKTEFIFKWTAKARKLKEELEPPANQR